MSHQRRGSGGSPVAGLKVNDRAASYTPASTVDCAASSFGLENERTTRFIECGKKILQESGHPIETKISATLPDTR
jgi:hypothetical protein